MTVIKTVNLGSKTKSESVSLPAVLTIAGSDSSGGAGIEADLKTFNAHKVYGLSCITCLTAQNTQLIKSTYKTSKNIIKDILEANFEDFIDGYKEPLLKAIKTGMLTKDAIEVLIEYLPYLEKNKLKLIVDPVMFSTSGFKLFEDEGLKLGIQSLYKKAYLITPNFEEAATLIKSLSGKECNIKDFNKLEDLTNFVVELQKVIGCKNILVKGGHIPWNSAIGKPATDSDDTTNLSIIDILYELESDQLTIFESKFLSSFGSHGTGCTLSSAIAANTAKGLEISEATLLGIRYVQDGMVSFENKVGYGNSPLNHTISPEERISNIISSSDSQSVNSEVLRNHSNFFDYLKSHHTVKDNWYNYVNHEFVRLLSTDNLPFNQFLYFLKQDFYYLHNYAQIHGYAASVAPTYKQTHAEAIIIGEVVEEMEKHKEKLCKKYNIDYERDIDIDVELNPGNACLAYCNYLLKLAKYEDFLGIKVALAPCLHGYAEAGAIGKAIRANNAGKRGVVEDPESAVYEAWIGDYTSEWYQNAHEEGKAALQNLLQETPISSRRLQELVAIFNEVTKLEVKFWDEVLKMTY